MEKGEKLVAVFAFLLAIGLIFVSFTAHADVIEIGRAPGSELVYDDNVGVYATPAVPEYKVIFDSMTDEDWEYLRRCVYRESARRVKDYETCKGMLSTSIAVCETVFNRVLDPEWPNTVKGVITDKRWGKQFCYEQFYGPYNEHYENEWQYQNVVDALWLFSNYSNNFVVVQKTYLPRFTFQFFATSKQSIAKNHIWVGMTNEDGSPKKPFGMYFGEVKQ